MELRKDYILDRYVIISRSRGKRPHQLTDTKKESPSTDFFAPGNESMTPPEITRIDKAGGGWQIRVIPNKFAAVDTECGGKCNPEIRTDNEFYTFADAYGKHEVIIESPETNKQLWDLDEEEIKLVLKMYNERIKALHKDRWIKYVNVFKNSGREGGTSIKHTHSQVIGMNILPKTIREKISAIGNYNYCPYCRIIESEKKSYRRCFESDEWFAYTPYASRFQYEIWIMPKKHIQTMEQFTEQHYAELSAMLKKVLLKLKEINAPYNYYIHYHPSQEFHFSIEVTPRLAVWAGFEEETGIIINAVSPEDAAKFYRSEE